MKNDEPAVGLNLSRKTTQVNLWIVAAVVLFFAVGGILMVRFLKDPPSSTPEMKQESVHLNRGLWAKALC